MSEALPDPLEETQGDLASLGVPDGPRDDDPHPHEREGDGPDEPGAGVVP